MHQNTIKKKQQGVETLLLFLTFQDPSLTINFSFLTSTALIF